MPGGGGRGFAGGQRSHSRGIRRPLSLVCGAARGPPRGFSAIRWLRNQPHGELGGMPPDHPEVPGPWLGVARLGGSSFPPFFNIGMVNLSFLSGFFKLKYCYL